MDKKALLITKGPTIYKTFRSLFLIHEFAVILLHIDQDLELRACKTPRERGLNGTGLRQGTRLFILAPH